MRVHKCTAPDATRYPSPN